jgi:uncharacterized protein (TIGR00106 family)
LLPGKELGIIFPHRKLALLGFFSKIPENRSVMHQKTVSRSFPMVLLEFSIYPLDKGESVGEYVARCLDIIDRSGLPYRLNAMGTVLEGDYDEVMDVVRQCFEKLAEDCHRIECVIKLDYRKGGTHRLDGKIASIEKKLGRELAR